MSLLLSGPLSLQRSSSFVWIPSFFRPSSRSHSRLISFLTLVSSSCLTFLASWQTRVITSQLFYAAVTRKFRGFSSFSVVKLTKIDDTEKDLLRHQILLPAFYNHWKYVAVTRSLWRLPRFTRRGPRADCECLHYANHSLAIQTSQDQSISIPTLSANQWHSLLLQNTV